MTAETLSVTVELSEDSAWDLAQLVKRLAWSDIRGCAVDDAEAYRMRDAVDKLQTALREAGANPR